MDLGTATQAIGLGFKVRRWSKYVTKVNYFRLKRTAMCLRRERQAMFLLHRETVHRVRDYVSSMDNWLAEAQDLVAARQSSRSLKEKIRQETTDVLNQIVDDCARFMTRQVPGPCSVCVKTNVTQEELLESAIYANALRLCNGNQAEVETKAGGRFDGNRENFCVATRARCSSSSKQRAELIQFCFSTASTAFAFFKPDGPSTGPFPKVVYCPDRDLLEFATASASSTTGANAYYLNPTPAYWRFYRSAAVFPIRLHELEAQSTAGYLCIDSPEPFAFSGVFTPANSPEEHPPFLHLGLAIADSCATLLAAQATTLDLVEDMDDPLYGEG